MLAVVKTEDPLKDPRPHVTLKVGDRRVSALVDTGAMVSVMSQKVFESLPNSGEFEQAPIRPDFRVTAANGTDLKVKGRYVVPFDILGMAVKAPVYVVGGLSSHTWIVGIDLIRGLHLSVNADAVALMTTVPSLVDGVHPLLPLEDFTVPARSVMRKKLFTLEAPETPKTGATVVVNNTFQVPHAWEGVSEIGQDGGVWCVLSNLLHEDVRVRAGDAVAVVDVVTPQECRELSDADIAAVTSGGKIKDSKTEPSEAAAPSLGPEELKEFLEALNIECRDNDEKRLYEQLCVHFHDVFSKNKYDLGHSDVIEHEIKLKDPEGDPVHVKQFPIPFAYREQIWDWVKELLSQGAIELSRSSYNLPIFSVPKPHSKGGKDRRIVLDFRAINQASVPDKYTIRDVRECVDQVGQNGSKVFSALDLTAGFWQQRLAEDSKQYTAFTVPGKETRYQWCVNPMGLSGAPASFARMIDFVTRGILHCVTYIDDLLVHTKTHSGQRETLRKVFLRFRKYNLKLNIKKSILAASELEYLGYHLSQEGVSPGLEKLGAMRQFPEPDSIKKVREFLGMANYFRFMIPEFAATAGHLTNLLKANSGYKEGPLPLDAANAFRKLKAALSDNPIVQHPALEGEWRVTTDASQGDEKHPGGLGAVLTQVVDGQERVIAYASRSLKSFEKNYSAYLLELAAAAWAIDHWQVYLAGRHFTLFTDHKPLTHLSTIHKKTLNRLQQQLNEFSFDIRYKPGEENCVADALSRNPVDVLNDESGSLEEAQSQDEFCRDVKLYLEKGVLPTHSDGYIKKVIRVAKDSEVIDGVLRYYLVREGKRPRMTVLLPEKLWHLVTEAAHNSWHAGHGGEDRTKERIFSGYYFPGVHNYVAKYIKSCPVCQSAKGKAPPPSPLKSLPLCDGPNERVHIDLFGPLKTSHEGNKFVMVMTDAWSKVVELAAIPNKQADTVAKCFFEKWICRYSVPLLVISDNGKEFANELMTSLMERLGCLQKRTSAYHPASNSSAESFNRSMIKYLRAMVLETSTLDWEAYLPALQLSYNCHVHRSTLESPFFLTYHMQPRLPYFDLEETRPLYKDDYVSHAFQVFSESHKRVYKNQWDARKIREAYYNKKTKERCFDVGDRVLRFVDAVPKNVNAKLHSKWQGPYYVVKKCSPLNYVIQQTPRSKEILVHVEKIKHLNEGEAKKCFNSKKVDNAEFEIFKGHQDCDGEANEPKKEDFVSSKMVMKSLAEPEKPDPVEPVLEPENVRVTRSKVRAGKAKLMRAL